MEKLLFYYMSHKHQIYAAFGSVELLCPFKFKWGQHPPSVHPYIGDLALC